MPKRNFSSFFMYLAIFAIFFACASQPPSNTEQMKKKTVIADKIDPFERTRRISATLLDSAMDKVSFALKNKLPIPTVVNNEIWIEAVHELSEKSNLSITYFHIVHISNRPHQNLVSKIRVLVNGAITETFPIAQNEEMSPNGQAYWLKFDIPINIDTFNLISADSQIILRVQLDNNSFYDIVFKDKTIEHLIDVMQYIKEIKQ